MTIDLPDDWRAALAPALKSEGFAALVRFVDDERARGPVFPAEGDVWRAFALTPLSAVKVVLVGQDPYHGDGQAHGLCFSVRPGTKKPPSLKNVFAELKRDLDVYEPAEGDLTGWARRGVLLLNTVLTVRAHEAHSHKGRGWEELTDAALRAVSARERPAVFCLWGNHAQKKAALVDARRHGVVLGAHPSPLSVAKFRGSRPFSAINRALQERGVDPLDWRF
ncbi:MAG: uracil-DNA glycosylase [Deltaproteobacteria bacterium]|nr:uracil-DNA glycosylase [Planctomycetota bacterium]MBM4280114.1 uracil-DNA glycosylase [Deltaproteobacteria bacterium]